MIKLEIYRVLKSKKSIILLCIMFLIPLFDLWLNWQQNFGYFLNDPEAYGGVLDSDRILHPSMASFLSGSSHGHMPQMLLIWILPIYLLLIYSDFYVTEKQIGYNNIIFSKSSRKKIIFSKFAVAFLIPFIISLLSLISNFLLANILFQGGVNFKKLDEMFYMFQEPLKISIKYPILAYSVYIIIYSIISGGVGIMCTSLSFLLPNYKLLYPCCIFLWIIQISSPFSIINVIQPFIEYGFYYIIPALIIFWSIVLILMLVGIIRKVRYDEY